MANIHADQPPAYSPGAALMDLSIFLSVMVLIRLVHVPGLDYMGNVLVNSGTTLVVATLLMYRRGETWASLGLCRPESFKKLAVITLVALGLAIAFVMAYKIFLSEYIVTAAGEEAGVKDTRFSDMAGNLTVFLSIVSLVWIESAFEELLDRGYLLTRLERIFSKIPLSLVIAVVGQAAIFGFRHMPSHGVDGAITTGLIGLGFGIVYVASGRNLWALIIAHCYLNSMSMVERFIDSY